MNCLVAIPSKSRPENIKSFVLPFVKRLNLDYKIFVEPQEINSYNFENVVSHEENNIGLGGALVSIKKYAEKNNYDVILKLDDDVSYDVETFEVDNVYRDSYYTLDYEILLPKLLDDDYVIMADGTPKSGYDLQIGDIIKTIDIPNAENVNTLDELVNYRIDMDTFLSGVVYSTNKVIAKKRIDSSVENAVITFTDGTNWYDTINSKYLVYENDEIKFKKIGNFIAGDIVVLIDTSDESNVQIVEKTVQSIDIADVAFSGWTIEVERAHLFLTANGDPTTSTVPYYVSIEHNNVSCFGTPYGGQGSCSKGFCCNGTSCSACIN
jgi:hypothetical protein